MLQTSLAFVTECQPFVTDLMNTVTHVSTGGDL